MFFKEKEKQWDSAVGEYVGIVEGGEKHEQNKLYKNFFSFKIFFKKEKKSFYYRLQPVRHEVSED